MNISYGVKESVRKRQLDGDFNEQKGKMKELGINEVVAEINRQLNEAQK